MIVTETKLKGWGNSIGVVLPKEDLRKAGLGVNDTVEIRVKATSNPLRQAWGLLKGVKPRSGKSTRAVLKEIDREFSKYD